LLVIPFVFATLTGCQKRPRNASALFRLGINPESWSSPLEMACSPPAAAAGCATGFRDFYAFDAISEMGEIADIMGGVMLPTISMANESPVHRRRAVAEGANLSMVRDDGLKNRPHCG
jgi:hypothetical protein